MRRAAFILLAVLVASCSLIAAENAKHANLIGTDPSFAGYVPNMIIVQLEENVIPTLGKQAQQSGNASVKMPRSTQSATAMEFPR